MHEKIFIYKKNELFIQIFTFFYKAQKINKIECKVKLYKKTIKILLKTLNEHFMLLFYLNYFFTFQKFPFYKFSFNFVTNRKSSEPIIKKRLFYFINKRILFFYINIKK